MDWISLEKLNGVNHRNEDNRRIIIGGCESFKQMLEEISPSDPSTRIMDNILRRVYISGGKVDKEKVGEVSKEIDGFISKLNGAMDMDDWNEISRNMNEIIAPLTNDFDKDGILAKDKNDPEGWMQNELCSRADQVRNCIDSSASGTISTAVCDALAQLVSEVKAKHPEDLGLDKKKLNLLDLCNGFHDSIPEEKFGDNALPSKGLIDSFIVCCNGHFMTLRKTHEDGWCIVDSLMDEVVPVEKAGRQKSGVEGLCFTDIIYFAQKNLDNYLREKFSEHK
ncbi:MAG: hypothetical protein LBF94_02910 [Puniceicoccales bacterium]|jgi:hypothetical protein|nr:hypothetical protein [Puniceicoccales bacterium]